MYRTTKTKWKTFIHNGVFFPESYKRHNLPVIYNNEKVYFDDSWQEETATLYAKYIGSEYIQNKNFNKNFWHDWKKILGPKHKIESLDKCDFSLITKYLNDIKEQKALVSKEEKEIKKIEKDKLLEPYKYAMVDDVKQPLANFVIEPPGIFIGRGDHPLLGKIKRRILPKDITLNLSKGAPVPMINKNGNVDGNGKWHKIIHDNTLEWIASWADTITGKKKYVWLGMQSDLRVKSDMAKFELARKLKKKINSIRKTNDANLTSTDLKLKQTATALYFIDNYALRVGGEKGEDQADTVGVTSLRVEHIEVLEDLKIKLDFLGKDSIRYINKVKVSEQIHKNIIEFMLNKNKDDDLFDLINSNDMNKYLSNFMKGLTAKVFRTLNASYHFQKELNKIVDKYNDYTKSDKMTILLNEYTLANTKIASLCNHQKKVSKTHETQLDLLDEKIKELKKKLKDTSGKEKQDKIKEKIKELKNKKKSKCEQKNLSLGTSKVNYIDPRITVAFMKKFDIPIDKLFTKTLQTKFKWAMDTPVDFMF